MKDTGERLIPKLHEQSIAYSEHLARYWAVADLVRDKEVLDIACGAGYGSQILAQQAEHVTGMDVSKEAVEYAQKNYPAANLEFRLGDANAIPLPDASVDVVISLETIEHIEHPEQLIKEVKRILRPNGVFIVSTPNDDEFTEGNEYHVHEFDFKKLSSLITKYFKQHNYYYQGSWYSSGILSSSKFESAFQPTPLAVQKTFGQPTKKAIYFLAIAGDAQIPELADNLAIGDVYSGKLDQEQHLKRVAHIEALDTEIEKQRQELVTLKQNEAALKGELAGIQQSIGWRMLQPLYKIKRRLVR